MTIEPIAIFRSPFATKFGIPRQSGLVDELKGTIVFMPKYSDRNALRGMEDFDYLWLIWGFSANKEHGQKFSPTVRPPRLGGNERIGVFASRSPFRPNGLALSSVRILSIHDDSIVVSGADLMDGTPIYDIKPYLPYVDSHPEARGGFTDRRIWNKLQVSIPDHLRNLLPDGEAKELEGVLALDPRPQYQDDKERIYGMAFKGRDIRFRVDGDQLEVIEINQQ